MTFSAGSSWATGCLVEDEDGLDVLGPADERRRDVGYGEPSRDEPSQPARDAGFRDLEVARPGLEVATAGVHGTEDHPVAEDHLAVPGREIDLRRLGPAG